MGLSPRVRGNPSGLPLIAYSPQGLSPRVRGNHAPVTSACFRRVYPRVYGGTLYDHIRSPSNHKQVYPRVYGGTQVLPFGVEGKDYRSIPACTGEPGSGSGSSRSVRGLSPRVRGNPGGSVQEVYPRVYGGTIYTRRAGLSPRVRGNRRYCRSSRSSAPEVYPRVYGGTQDCQGDGHPQ